MRRRERCFAQRLDSFGYPLLAGGMAPRMVGSTRAVAAIFLIVPWLVAGTAFKVTWAGRG